MRFWLVTRIMFVGFLASCDGGGKRHVDLSGKSPAEGSALAADEVCDNIAACGSVSVGCTVDSTGAMGCTATILPTDYASCYNDAQGDLQDLLACPALTPDDVNAIEACFDAFTNRPCLTQAQADALARQAEANDGHVLIFPAECAAFDAGFPGCT